ncbi:DUF732 domain-containing protein [Actinoplanes solisilvae]|uniref:DUF732 domain-containing protein n=1 Tax=Actinoplanes solisilvae TaxID=2486853 RepID=UPI000FDC7761|nr:DUF732 domain-containing protein [Actinoplanes solisilvae]
MRVRVWAVAVSTVGALMGCASAKSKPVAEPTGAAPTESASSTAFLEPGWRISDDLLRAYQEALVKIDKGLAENKEIVRYAGEICRDIRQGRTDAQVVNHAATQFQVDAAVATQIVEATKSTVCAK